MSEKSPSVSAFEKLEAAYNDPKPVRLTPGEAASIYRALRNNDITLEFIQNASAGIGCGVQWKPGQFMTGTGWGELGKRGRNPKRAVSPSGQKMFTCSKHGWGALGSPCPECKGGDAPRSCAKHGWAHISKGCPDCASGK